MLLAMGTSLHQAAASYDAEGFKSAAGQYNEWAASIDSSIALFANFLKTVEPEKDEESSSTTAEQSQTVKPEDEITSTTTITPSRGLATSPAKKEDGDG